MRTCRSPAALFVSLASLLSACGESAPPPAPAPVAAPKPAPPPEPTPPPPPTGRALLVASEFGLSPIACFLDQTRQFAAGEACLPIATTGAEVWLMSGQAAKITGRGASECAGAASEPTLTIDAARDLLRGEAVFPVELKQTMQYAPPSMPADVDRAAPKELREQVAAALSAAFPTLGAVKPRIDQRAALDLDGDGQPEALIAASVPGPTDDDDAPLRVSALLLATAGGPPTLLRGRADAHERYTVIGAIDLDGDGRRELYLNTYDPDGFSLSLERQAADGLHTEGRWSCGG